MPALILGDPLAITGMVLTVLGLALALWTILDQLLRARGTPLPVMATKVLLVTGPFRYCRNPMSLGAITAYLGISFVAGSWTSIGLVVIFSGLLLLYLKIVEERELQTRFGQAYRDYKSETPFIVPRVRRPRLL